MSRCYCLHCQRPEATCICRFITAVDNRVKVVVLQHPSEVAQAKGSLTLLKHSLINCEVIVGENFSQHQQVNQLIASYQDQCILLYPGEHASCLSTMTVNRTQSEEDICLMLIDATWKKAYRMFMLSKNLQQLPQVSLPAGFESRYAIRKTRKANGLSTLEACCHALSFLERDPHKYEKLLEQFVAFNQFLIHLRQRHQTNHL